MPANPDKEVWLRISAEMKSGAWFIAAVTAIAFAAGVWNAMTAPKTYEANAIIAPKKTAAGSGVLSQLGGLGGIISTQMGLMNTGNERLAFTLGTREVVGRVITGQNLLPKLYPALWDDQAEKWKAADSSVRPTLQDAIEMVRAKVMRVSINPKKELITLNVMLGDSAAVAPVAEAFLQELNESIKGRVRKDAEANRVYLEEQLASTSDPLLREKLQSLIAGEIEKAMLVGSWAFDLLEPPVAPLKRSGPNRKRIVAFAVSSGLISSVLLVLLFHRLLAMLSLYRRRGAK
jgi:uncharacterized protein involved in exopolysaccharide biosynthesis